MEEFKVFTDGSVSNNGRNNCKGGIGIYFSDNNLDNVKCKLNIPKITNNICELLAGKEAINIIINKKKFLENIENKIKNKIIIYTDSCYLINCITLWYRTWQKNNWKNSKKEPVKNIEIIHKLREYYLKYDIDFRFVKAHQKKPKDENSIEYYEWYGNYMADKLAFESHNN